MKTYHWLGCIAMALMLGCSAEEAPSEETPIASETVTYELLLDAAGAAKAVSISANAKSVLTVEPGNVVGTLEPNTPQARDGQQAAIWTGEEGCSGHVLVYDAQTGTSNHYDPFPDYESCALEIYALSLSGDRLYLSYGKKDTQEGGGGYFIRKWSQSGTYEDIEVDSKPLQLVISKGNLFLMGLQEKAENPYSLTVYQASSGSFLKSIALNEGLEGIHPDGSGNLILAYTGKHTVIDAAGLQVLAESHYASGVEPRFGSDSNLYGYGTSLYYVRPEPSGMHPTIPATYDFYSKTAFLYPYQKFLEADLYDDAYSIGNTEWVWFDNVLNLVVVGYARKDNPKKGGILRFKPAPDPHFVDQTDVDGIPMAILAR